jgi:hypothetical protein
MDESSLRPFAARYGSYGVELQIIEYCSSVKKKYGYGVHLAMIILIVRDLLTGNI